MKAEPHAAKRGSRPGAAYGAFLFSIPLALAGAGSAALGRQDPALATAILGPTCLFFPMLFYLLHLRDGELERRLETLEERRGEVPE